MKKRTYLLKAEMEQLIKSQADIPDLLDKHHPNFIKDDLPYTYEGLCNIVKYTSFISNLIHLSRFINVNYANLYLFIRSQEPYQNKQFDKTQLEYFLIYNKRKKMLKH